MSQQHSPEFTAVTRKYMNTVRIPHHSRSLFLRWMLTVPFRSRFGGSRIARYVNQPAPSAWAEDLAGKRVLIVGSGPSLDKVAPGFFDDFDTIIYINFALKRMRGTGSEYFFTTDLGPVREFIDAYEEKAFLRLGKDRCVYAPIYLDQYSMMKPAGRELFSWLRFDNAGWRTQSVKLARMKLAGLKLDKLTVPLVLRYHPRQPDWDAFQLPSGGRTLPILDHTSALTAVLFAAMHGSRSIGLIGCDFSAGRASTVATTQDIPTANTFSGAASEFRKLAAALARQDVEVTNHSWLVQDT